MKAIQQLAQLQSGTIVILVLSLCAVSFLSYRHFRNKKALSSKRKIQTSQKEKKRKKNEEKVLVSKPKKERTPEPKKEIASTSCSDDAILAALSHTPAPDARREAMKILYQNLPNHPNYPKD